jgi:thymidylate kinase
LYDRYYFDFINDAKRSNIELNRGFLRALYVFIFKPDLNLFLYADAETILSRKKEMSAEEIDRISTLYKDLFARMSDRNAKGIYACIENKKLSDTLHEVIEAYQKVA